MNGHAKVVVRSVLSLVATVAIGGGVTYALFTSNAVTVSQTNVSTGTANLRICNSNQGGSNGDNLWKNSIQPTIDYSGLNPGDTAIDIAPGSHMFLGNDNGSLDTKATPDCTDYGVAKGTSSASFKMVPSLPSVTCTDDSSGNPLLLKDAMSLRFTFGTSATTYKTLAQWVGNTTPFSPTFAAGDAKALKLEAKLDSAYTTQGQKCTFDITFVGQQ